MVATMATDCSAKRDRGLALGHWADLYGKVTQLPNTTKFLATLTYSYFVGEFRSGTYDREFSREVDADEFAREVKDRVIQIRYEHGNPDVSCPEASQVEQIPVAVLHLQPRPSAVNRIAQRLRPSR